MHRHDRPQILEHRQQSVAITPYDTKWIPGTARFVALGAYARNTGAFQVWGLDGNELVKLTEKEKKFSLKCGTFGASPLYDHQLATGDFGGRLVVYDTERADPTYEVQAHGAIVNAIDGIAGTTVGYGAPELVTGGRDGRVCVWDVRQKDAPVAAFEPASADTARDCWAVAFGNSYDDQERCVLAGYDNGDIKLFDLRANAVRWESNVGNGICGLQFDRNDIKMNKFVVTCLESQFHVFDARTQHPAKGFASVTEALAKGATIWGAKHLPQNREISMVQGGDGALHLYRYRYPDQRAVKDKDDEMVGVAGKMELLTSNSLSTQPIGSFDWSQDKLGLCCMSSFDQCLRVAFVTKLNQY